MKRILLPLLLCTILPVVAQQSTTPTPGSPRKFTLTAPESYGSMPPRTFGLANPQTLLSSQSGPYCEETILSATLSRPARMELVAASNAQPTAPTTLRVELANHTEKPVKSVDLLARLKIKENRYQLDATTRELPLHLSSPQATQQLKLTDSAVGFAALFIEKVTYTDGTTWQPDRHACGYRPSDVSILITR